MGKAGIPKAKAERRKGAMVIAAFGLRAAAPFLFVAALSLWAASCDLDGSKPDAAICSLVAPANSSTTSAKPLLDWDGVSGAEYYRIQLSTDRIFGAGIIVDTQGIKGGDDSFQVQTSLPNGSYYWRVRARISAKWKAYGPAWSFIVAGSNSPYTFKLSDVIGKNQTQMMGKGMEIFDEVMRSYKVGMASDSFLPALAVGSDFRIFPYNYGDEDAFYERMDQVYNSSDSIATIYGLFITGGSAANRSRGEGFASIFKNGLKAVESQKVDAAVKIVRSAIKDETALLEDSSSTLDNISATLELNQSEMLREAIESQVEIKGLGSQIVDLQAYLTEQTEYLKGVIGDQLAAIDEDLTSFQADFHDKCSEINSNIDAIVESLNDVKGEINNLSADIETIIDSNLKSKLDSSINNLRNFYSNYAAFTTLENFRSFLSSYKTDYYTRMADFYDAAVAAQSYAVSHDAYAETMMADAKAEFSKYRAIIDHAGERSIYSFDYSNPKGAMIISYGNLEYLYKYMVTKFLMNRFLYGGESLAINNTSNAKLFLSTVETLKAAVLGSINRMSSEYAAHVDHFKSFYSGLYSGISNISYEKYDPDTSIWETYSFDQTSIFEKDLVASSNEAFMDYLGLYSTELVSLEVDLESYLSDSDLSSELAKNPFAWQQYQTATEPAGEVWSKPYEPLAGDVLSRSRYEGFDPVVFGTYEPVVGNNGEVYLIGTGGATGKPRITAYGDNGAELWHVEADYFVGSPAVAPDGSVYVPGGGIRNKAAWIYAYDGDGTVEWNGYLNPQFYQPEYGDEPDPVSGCAVASDGSLWASVLGTLQQDTYEYHPATIVRIAVMPSSSGNPISVYGQYSYQAGNIIAKEIFPPVVDASGNAYAMAIVSLNSQFATPSGILLALSPVPGLRWKYDLGSLPNSRIVIDGRDRIVFTSGSNVYCLSQDGSPAWTYERAGWGNICCSPAIGSEDVVYFNGPDGSFNALNYNGTLKWKHSGVAPSKVSPAVGEDGIAYFYSGTTLYAMDEWGSILWQHDVGEAPIAPLAVGEEGGIYVTTATRIIAF